MASGTLPKTFSGLRENFDLVVSPSITVLGFSSPAAARRFAVERGIAAQCLNIRQRWTMEFT